MNIICIIFNKISIFFMDKNPKTSQPEKQPSKIGRLLLAAQYIGYQLLSLRVSGSTDLAPHLPEGLMPKLRWFGVSDLEYDKLKQDATHDRLTGLLNERAWFDAVSGNTDGYVVFLDLDGFKALNDEIGHAKADEEVLQPVGELLKNCGGEIIACRRSEGDEFMVYIPANTNLRLLTEYLESEFKEINSNISSKAKAGATIGIALVNTDGDSDKFRDLIDQTDILVNQEKERRAQRNKLIEYIMKLLKMTSRGRPSNGRVNFVYGPDLVDSQPQP